MSHRHPSGGSRSAPLLVSALAAALWLGAGGCATGGAPGAEAGARAEWNEQSIVAAAPEDLPGAPSAAVAEPSGPAPGPEAGGDEAWALEDDAELDALSAELDEHDADPFEPVNRHVFAFNQGVDALVLDPVTRTYGTYVPEFGKESIRNFFRNLNTPQVLVNDLLQLRGRDAAITTTRFLINTTLGMGGFFDPATSFGLDAHVSDFSQTLSAVGIGTGPYIVVPVMGPTTVRDGVGTLVDTMMAPLTWVLPVVGTLAISGSDGITRREEQLAGLDALRESSVDYYSALRTAYLQSRRAATALPADDEAQGFRLRLPAARPVAE